MDVQEQHACRRWARAAMAEYAGKPSVERPSRIRPGGTNFGYCSSDWSAMFYFNLPKSVANRIIQLGNEFGNYWEVWPQLTEAELGEVMKAGAANFFEPTEATP